MSTIKFKINVKYRMSIEMARFSPLGRAAFVSISHSLHKNNINLPPLSTNSFACKLMSSNTNTNTDSDGQKVPGPPLVDVDCNLLHKDLASVMGSISSIDVDSEINDALKILHHPSTIDSNIIAMVSPSSTIKESERSVQLLESCTSEQRNDVSIKTTVGVHPYHAKEEDLKNLAPIRNLLNRPNAKQLISCIGETGLDYSDGFPDKEYQIPWFKAQLDLAYDHELAVFLHERLAFEDTLQCIDEAIANHVDKPIPKIIVHCYTGTYDECIEYMKRGYYTSISGYIMKPSEGSDEVRKCLHDGIIPMDKLMLETDAPYMGFAGNKDSFFDAEGDAFSSLNAKKRKRLKSMYPNVASALPLVLKAVCDEINSGRETRGEPKLSLEELARITTENAINFFGLDKI